MPLAVGGWLAQSGAWCFLFCAFSFQCHCALRRGGFAWRCVAVDSCCRSCMASFCFVVSWYSNVTRGVAGWCRWIDSVGERRFVA
eukprot:9215649-Pyramimonas_sp.AAC.3